MNLFWMRRLSLLCLHCLGHVALAISPAKKAEETPAQAPGITAPVPVPTAQAQAPSLPATPNPETPQKKKAKVAQKIEPEKGPETSPESDIDTSGLEDTTVGRSGIDGRGFVGLQFGISLPSEADSNPRPILGVDGGYFVAPQITAGLSYAQSRENSLTTNTRYQLNIYLLGAQVLYHSSDFIDGLFVGAQMSLTAIDYISESTTLTTSFHQSTQSISLGPRLGYDYRFSNGFAVTGEMDLDYMPKVQALGPFTLVSLSLGLKYFF